MNENNSDVVYSYSDDEKDNDNESKFSHKTYNTMKTDFVNEIIQ